MATRYEESFQTASQETGIPSSHLKALASQETNIRQINSKQSNALGVLQIIPKWHPALDPERLANDPDYNIRGGAAYLADLIDKTDPNLPYDDRFGQALQNYYGSKNPAKNEQYARSVMGKIGDFPQNEESKSYLLPGEEAAYDEWLAKQKSTEQEPETYLLPGEEEAYKEWLTKKQAEPVQEDRTAKEVGGDVGTAVEKGIIGVPQALVGLADIPTKGRFGKYLEEKGYNFEKMQKQLSEQYSPQQKEDIKALEEAKGISENLKAAMEHPEAVLSMVGESAIPAVAGGMMGRVAKAAGLVKSTAVAAGVGEGLLAAGQSAQDIRVQSPERELSTKGALSALGAGAGTAALGTLGSKATTALGGIDLDTLIVGGARKAITKEVGEEVAKTPGMFRRVITSAFGEGVLEEAPQSAQEQMFQNYATDKPLLEGIENAAIKGTMLGSVMGGGIGLVPTGKAEEPTPTATPTTTPVEEKPLTEREIEYNKDQALKQRSNEIEAIGIPPETKLHDELLAHDLSTPEGVAEARKTIDTAIQTETDLPEDFDIGYAEDFLKRAEENLAKPKEVATPEAEVTAPTAEVTTPTAETVAPEEQGVVQKQQTVEAIKPTEVEEKPDWLKRPEEQGVAQKQQTVEAVKPTEEQDTTGLASGFTEMLGDMSESHYKQAFESLQQGKTTISGVKDPILTRAKEAFDKGLIQHPEDIKNFEQNGYPKTTKGQIVQPETDQTFSVAPTKKSTPYTAELLKRSLTPEMRRLVDSGKAVLHDTQDTLPGTNHPANVQGMTTPEGITHYVANKLNPTTIQNVALHEVGVHTGLRNMVGDKVWEDVKNQAMTNQGPEFDAARASIPKDTPAHLHAEEALAYLVENSSHLPFIRRLIAAVRNWARTTFGTNLRLSQDDARHLATRALRKESQSKKTTARKEGTAFSKGRLLAPNGKPSNLNATQYAQVRTPAFKKWFGDWENDPENASKMLDENGEPKKYYHLTEADIKQFYPGGDEFAARNEPIKGSIGAYKVGTLGLSSGHAIWFAEKPEDVQTGLGGARLDEEGYKRPNIIPVFLNARKKIVMDTEEKLQNIYNQVKPHPSSLPKPFFTEDYTGERIRVAPEKTDFPFIIDWRQRDIFEKNKIDALVYKHPNPNDKNKIETEIIVFNPNQIKSAIGNTGAFSTENADIRYSISPEDRTAAESAERRRAENTPPPVSKPKRTFGEVATDTLDMIETMATSFDARYINQLRRSLNKSLKKGDMSVADITKVMLRASQAQSVHAGSVGAQGAIRGGLKKNDVTQTWDAVDAENNMPKLRLLIEDIAKSKGQTFEEVSKQFGEIMVASRIAELRQRPIEIKAKIDSATDEKVKKLWQKKYDKAVALANNQHLTEAEVAEQLGVLARNPEYKKPMDEWKAVRKNMVTFLKDTGRYSQAQAEAYLDAIAYVPFTRVMDRKDVESVYDTMAQGHGKATMGLTRGQAEHTIKGSKSREVDDIITNMERWVLNSFVKGMNADKGRELVKISMINMPAGTVVNIGRNAKNKEGAVVVYEDGVKQYYRYADPLIPFAFNGINPVALPALKLGAKFANKLRQSIVLNPLFTISQLPQDTFSAMFSSGLKNPMMLPAETVKEFVKTLMGTSKTHEVLKTRGATGQKDPMDMYAQSIHDIAYNQPSTAKGVVGASILDKLNRFSMAGDNALRQAIYNRTLKEMKGRPDAEAIATQRAFEIINFRRRGASASVDIIRQITPFLGAYLQAQRVAINTLSGRGIAPSDRKEALATLAATTAQVVALTFLYNNMLDDDEEFKKKSARDKDTRIFVMGSKSNLTLPLRPDIFSLPFVMGNHAYRAILDKGTENPEVARRAMSDAVIASLVGMPMGPTIIKPVVEVVIDHDFFTGRPLISQKLAGFEEELQYTAGSSEIAKMLGHTGMISPIAVDHLVRGFFGYSGGAALLASDVVLRGMFDLPYASKGVFGKGIRDIPGVPSLYADEKKTQVIDSFFKMNADIDTAYRTEKRYKDLGRKEEAREYKTSHKELLNQGVRSTLHDMSVDISELRKKKDKILETPNEKISPEAKRERVDKIDERIARIMKRVPKLENKVYK